MYTHFLLRPSQLNIKSTKSARTLDNKSICICSDTNKIVYASHNSLSTLNMKIIKL